MATDDYYKVLGVERTANEDDIRKAYRKLALQWHPDKNPGNKEEAERRFKEISEAYQVLSDGNRRSAYDCYGKSGTAFASGGQFNSHFQSPADLFQQFFGNVDGMSFIFGPNSCLNGHFNMNSHSGYHQSAPIRFFTFSSGSAGFPYQMNEAYFDNSFCNSVHSSSRPFRSQGSYEDNLYREIGRPFSSRGLDAQQKMSQSSVNIINGQRVVTTIEVDDWEEIITVETDGVITSRTINGVEVPQNMPPSLSRSTVPRTADSRQSAGHSTDRLQNSGTSGSSGISAPYSASNSVLFNDSKRCSTADSYSAGRTNAPSSSTQLEQKEVPATKGISVQKQVPSGMRGTERKDVPVIRTEVLVGMEVRERIEVPAEIEISERKEVPVRMEVPEDKAVSSNSSRKTLLYSRVVDDTPRRIISRV